MPTIGASLAASIVAWALDALIAPIANLWVRVLLNVAVSVWVFYVTRRWLRELRGD